MAVVLLEGKVTQDDGTKLIYHYDTKLKKVIQVCKVNTK